MGDGIGADQIGRLAEQFRSYSTDIFHGASPLYEKLAMGVADDQEILSLCTAAPPSERVPML
ncbi:MAG: DUF2332 family protein, partial [Candidatus Latescibacteria bacterium]|nr:DUF2332 family protein [Candidatus Latescibacterota bacterium]